MQKIKTPWLLISLAIMIICAIFIWGKTTSWGNILNKRATFVYITDDGIGETGSYLLMVPKGVSPENPAPAAVIVHGITSNTYYTTAYGIELARRGYVVFLPDIPGAGKSSMLGNMPYAAGMDLTPFLTGVAAQLQSMSFVDQKNVIAIGYSAGRGAATTLVNLFPDYFKTLMYTSIYSSSAAKTIAALGVNFVGVAADAGSAKQAGGNYGDGMIGSGNWNDRTASYAYICKGAVPHTFQPFNREMISAIVSAAELSSPTKTTLASDDLNFNNTFFTLLGMAALAMFVYALVSALLGMDEFKSIVRPPTSTYPRLYDSIEKPVSRQVAKWLTFIVPMLLVCACYFVFAAYTQIIAPFKATKWAASWANVYIPFLVSVAIMQTIIFVVYHKKVGKPKGGNAVNYGLAWEGSMSINLANIGKCFAIGIIVTLSIFAIFEFFDSVMGISYMFAGCLMVCALTFETALQFPIYVLVFILAFVCMSLIPLIVNKYVGKGNSVKDAVVSDIITTVFTVMPFIALIVWNFLRQTEVLIVKEPTPWTFLPLNGMYGYPIFMLIVMPVLNRIYRKTNSIWAGAIITAFLSVYILLCGYTIQISYFA